MLFRFSLTTHKNGYNPIEKCDDTKLTGGQFRPEWGGQHDRNIDLKTGPDKKDII